MNKLHISPLAKEDMHEIKAYIEDELASEFGALNTIKKITNSMRMLEKHALVGKSLSSVINVESDYRYLVSGNYLIFYRTQSNNVYIDRVIYSRRDYISILFEGMD